MSKKGTVNIHGKEYKTVALRVNEFREQCPITQGWGILTEVVFRDSECVVVKATITDPDGRIVGVGHGEEYRSSSKINKTSALENAETSAVGRALAASGLGGEEYASADEVIRAIQQQESGIFGEKKEPPKEEPKSNVDNKEVVDDLICVLRERFGDDEARVWHQRTIANFFNKEKLSDMTNDELGEYAKLIETKIKNKED